jgi:hypothetical protein
LLEGGEWSRLDDVGRDGSGQAGDDQRRQRTGQREDGARERHDDKQQAVAAAPPKAVAVASDQHGDERGSGEERSENNADCGVGEAAVGQSETDQHRAEPVGKRSCALGGDEPARVGAQPCSS